MNSSAAPGLHVLPWWITCKCNQLDNAIVRNLLLGWAAETVHNCLLLWVVPVSLLWFLTWPADPVQVIYLCLEHQMLEWAPCHWRACRVHCDEATISVGHFVDSWKCKCQGHAFICKWWPSDLTDLHNTAQCLSPYFLPHWPLHTGTMRNVFWSYDTLIGILKVFSVICKLTSVLSSYLK